jgi:hypothetical protein
MKNLTWDRTARISEVRDRIWSYLSPASRFEEEGLLTAAALLKWPADDAARLGELQFLLSEQVGRLIDTLPSLLRKLTTSSSREEEWDFERLRGPVLWSRTLALRAAGGSPHLWVTSPARRDYQTVENRILVYVLDAVVELGRTSGWADQTSPEAPSVLVRQRVASAEFWLQSRLLTQIERIPLSPRDVNRVRAGRANQRYAAVIEAYDCYHSLVHVMDREAVRAAVEHAGLVTAAEGTLFELLCLFNTIEALNRSGWSMSPIHLFYGRLRINGRRPDGRRLQLHYQSNPADMPTSRYKAIQSLHSFPQSQELRPDMVLMWDAPSGPPRWLLAECKLSKHGVIDAARKALNDLLAYRRAFSPLLDQTPEPYGLGLAWGGDLAPDVTAEIMLATPDTLAIAMSAIVA